MTNPRKRTAPLTVEEICATALGIVDADGLDALTMRRLASEVGVEAASLYHHIPNKDALINGMLVKIRSEVLLPEPLPDDRIDIYTAIFAEYRRVLTAHPNLIIYAGRRVESDPSPDGLQGLVELGLSEDDAVGLWQSMIAFVTGFALFSSQAAEIDTSNQPPGLATRLADWRGETADKAMRAILEGYAGR